jgi:hypothetical protein
VGPPDTAVSDSVSSHDDLWERLLQYIDDGLVVPIVGHELLGVTIGDQSVQFYDYLAGRLAERLHTTLPVPAPRAALNAVASRFLEQGGEPERIYAELQRIVRDTGPLPTPPSLQKLAEITSFRLFVTTTCDSMLLSALNAVRYGGLSSSEVVAYSPDNPQDAPQDIDDGNRSIVCHLLGRLSSMQQYVVTEEDALEFLHHLLFQARPKRLFGHIQRRNLLILGCSFPTWIVRFFIRASRESRLLFARGKMDVVVDSGTREDLSLVRFLQGYKTRTEVFDSGTAVDFVDELHKRWTARHPAPAAGGAEPAASRAFVRPGAIFVSYASEDRAIVQGISDSLEKAGMDVWFDRHDLVPGDDFDRKIRFTIEACSLFVPVLSKSCLKRNRRFLQLEWDCARNESRKVLASRHFIVPVVIDDVALDDPDIPEEFKARQAARLTGGQLSDDIIAGLRNDYREFQKRRGGL